MNFENQFASYQRQVTNGHEKAIEKLCNQSSLLFKPYSNDYIERMSLVYPFAHAAQCLLNAVSIVYGIYLLGKSILTLQKLSVILTLILNPILICAQLLLNACNLLVALFSLGSRCIATMLNGYLLTPTLGGIDDNPVTLERHNTQRELSDEQLNTVDKDDENNGLVFDFV